MNRIKNFENKLLYLLYLIPIALLTGPFIGDLIITIIAAYFIFISIRLKLWTYYTNQFFLISISFYAYILMRSLFSTDIYLSLEHSLFFFRYIFFIFAIVYFYNNHETFIKKFKFILFLSVLFVSLDGYYQLFFDFNIFGFSANGNHSLTGVFNDRDLLGYYICRMSLLCIATSLWNTEKIPYTVIAIVLLNAPLLFYIGDRSEFILFIFGILAISIFIRGYLFLKLGTFFLIIISCVILFMTFPNLKDRYVNTIYESVNTNKEIFILSPKHNSMFESSYNMFLDNPIFGQGSKMFRKLCSNDEFKVNYEGIDYDTISFSCSTHPHNIYLELLSEQGIVGTSIISVLYIYLIYFLFKKSFKFKSVRTLNDNENYIICLTICILINFFPLTTSMSFFNNWSSIISYLPIGLLLASLNYKNRLNKQE
jgi:O-antigen ligase